jgi:hypothetical protein
VFLATVPFTIPQIKSERWPYYSAQPTISALVEESVFLGPHYMERRKKSVPSNGTKTVCYILLPDDGSRAKFRNNVFLEMKEVTLLSLHSI